MQTFLVLHVMYYLLCKYFHSERNLYLNRGISTEINHLFSNLALGSCTLNSIEEVKYLSSFYGKALQIKIQVCRCLLEAHKDHLIL